MFKKILFASCILIFSYFQNLYASTITVTAKSPNVLSAVWVLGPTFNLTFSVDANCYITCHAEGGDRHCDELMLMRQYSDYANWIWQKYLKCNKSSQGIDWVLQTEVINSGGSKTYSFKEFKK